MNSEIQREVLLLTEIDNIKGSEAIKILSICSNVLGTNKYMEEVIKLLNNIFCSPDFDIFLEFSHVLLTLSELNKKLKYYKDIKLERIKYVLFAVLFQYLNKHQCDLLNLMGVSKFRIMYSNNWELLSKSPKYLEILKESWTACVGRSMGWNCCTENNIFIK